MWFKHACDIHNIYYIYFIYRDMEICPCSCGNWYRSTLLENKKEQRSTLIIVFKTYSEWITLTLITYHIYHTPVSTFPT